VLGYQQATSAFPQRQVVEALAEDEIDTLNQLLRKLLLSVERQTEVIQKR